jgi:hypothetical protein
MRSRLSFVLLLLSLITSSCIKHENTEDCHSYIVFKNGSSKDIYISWATFYPDTTINNIGNLLLTPDVNKAVKHSENQYAIRIRDLDCFESRFFDGVQMRSDTLTIFTFDAETVENTPWDTVTSKYLVLQRYDLSLRDLQKLNWSVPFPPSPEMKDMKMYPPYKKQ